MMTSNPLRDERVAALGALMVVAAIAAGTGFYVFAKHQWAADKLATLEPRYARLLGLKAKEAELGSLALSTSTQMAQLAYPAADDATKAGNTAQQRIRDVFTRAGLEVVGTQVLAAKVDKQFERIPISVRLEGDMASLSSSLIAIQQERPLVMVDNLSIQPAGAAKAGGAVKLSAQLTVSVVRVAK